MATYQLKIEDKKKQKVIEGLLKLLNVSFKRVEEKQESPYDPEFVKMIKEREQNGVFKTFKNGKELSAYLKNKFDV